MTQINITHSAVDAASAQSIVPRASWRRSFLRRMAPSAHLNAIQDVCYTPPPPPPRPCSVARQPSAGAARAALRASIVTIGILLLASGQNALAFCTYSDSVGGVSKVFYATLVMPKTLVIRPNLDHDKTIYSVYPLETPSFYATCTGRLYYDPENDARSEYLAPIASVINDRYVQQTNIPGIGVLAGIFIPYYQGGGYYSTISNGVPNSPHAYARISGWYKETFTISLVRTGGTISPGRLSLPSPLVGTYSIDATGKRVSYARLLVSGTTQILIATCTVKSESKNIAVSLPPIVSGLVEKGFSHSTNFRIALICDRGAKVFYQIDGTSPPGMDASLGVLANRTATNDARGVGVRIRAGSISPSRPWEAAPVTLGRRSAVVFVASTEGEAFSIPFVAYYYKTGPTVTPGTVWAQATFTMDYE